MSDFATTHARATDPATSLAAAASVESASENLCGRILWALRRYGPMTHPQIAGKLGLKDAQVWKRISDLVRDGRVRASGKTLPGVSGRLQNVWEAA